VERLSCGAEDAVTPPDPRLENVTIAPLTEPLAPGASLQAGVYRIAPGGRMARHPATVRQLLVVVDGSGWVSGRDGREEPIGAGEAVVWEPGEEHETRSAEGLTAVIVQSDAIVPFGG
jgi:quercetin dioxygenase-like cupin family protein